MNLNKIKTKLKQLLCDHKYISYLRSEPTYLSVGDKYHKRKSYEYYLICSKCKHMIEVVDTWKNEDIRKEHINKIENN